jgi:hypothetical protein
VDKVLWGSLSAIATVIGFIPYVHSILQRKTTPHFFTWLVWGALTGIIFAIQVAGHAGPGSWGIGVTALTCIVIMVLSFFWGEKSGTRFDWIALIASIATIPLWLATSDPTYSAILVTFIDVAAFYPTVSKTYRNPWSEHMFYYWIWLVKYPTSIVALTVFTVANAIYPITWTIIGIAFLAMTFYRRAVINKGIGKDQ